MLILDNADDLSLLSAFIPTNGEGHLLTRATATGTLASRMMVERMEPDEGALLLLRRSKLLAADAALVHSELQLREQAYVLVALLDGLPLALDQAGAYLEETGCSLQEYIELYRQRRMALLDRRGTVLSDYPYTVASTWLLSLDQVEQQSPAAAELLRLLALLNPDVIAESLLRQGASLLVLVLGPIVADPFLLNEAIQVLRRFSLVQRHPNTQSLSLHRLVQVVVQEEMDIQTRHIWIECMVALLNAVFPEDESNIFQNVSWCLELLPHAQVAADLMERFQVFTLGGADLLRQTVQYLGSNYVQNRLTERLCQLALKIYEQLGLMEHPEVATLFMGLGLSAWTRGRFDQALAFNQRALAIWQRVLGMDNASTAVSYNGLGRVHQTLAHYEQARAMYQQALVLLERILGPEHTYTAMVLTNLGELAISQKDYTQAEHLHQRALAIFERDDPHNLAIALCLSNMGSVYSVQHRYNEAEEVLQQALTLYEQGIGSDFSQVGVVFSHLGNSIICKAGIQNGRCNREYHAGCDAGSNSHSHFRCECSCLVGSETIRIFLGAKGETSLVVQIFLGVRQTASLLICFEEKVKGNGFQRKSTTFFCRSHGGTVEDY